MISVLTFLILFVSVSHYRIKNDDARSVGYSSSDLFVLKAYQKECKFETLNHK
jgi:hypothetical protein